MMVFCISASESTIPKFENELKKGFERHLILCNHECPTAYRPYARLRLSRDRSALARNAAGVSMGHIHLTVRDMDAKETFFKLLGGTPVSNGPLRLIEFPGIYVMLRKGEPSGGSVGSTVNHFGFQVRSMKDWLPKWQAAGLRMEPVTRPTQVYLLTPDDIRAEILEEPSLATPIAGHHIHFATQDIPGMQAWYVENVRRGSRQASPV